MTADAEAAGDALTGALVAQTIDAGKGAPASGATPPDPCRNCGTMLNGAYCAACGQAAHIHRSLRSLGHDILHSAFHFEGKIFKTLPELFLRPGRLTRRYIDGERAKFVSPMALFLFTVFAMFAVFSLTGQSFDEQLEGVTQVKGDVQAGYQSALDTTNQKIAATQEQLAQPNLAPQDRARLQQDLSDLHASRVVMEALVKGEWNRIGNIKQELEKQGLDRTETSPERKSGIDVNLQSGNSELEARLEAAANQVVDNPALFAYKLKTNSYKFSWMLIPLSVPFLWLLFFWRRDIHLYDHAIFATYSISFIMLLMILVSVAATFGAPAWAWGSALTLAPPIHMYKQLRYAYGLSRSGALIRLFFLLLFVTVVLVIFGLLLLLAGAFA